jgi:Holliday junction resolvase RusA-like endonuclease
MTREVSFCVPGLPIAKGRARMSTRGGFVRSYTPAKTRKYEAQVSSYAAEAMGREPFFDGPVEVEIQAGMMIPQSWSKKKRESAQQLITWPVSRPDLDNIIKAALDGINEVVFADDSQVVKLYGSKFYSATPHLKITIREVGKESGR